MLVRLIRKAGGTYETIRVTTKHKPKCMALFDNMILA
jgi:hypothetical protein